jgi:hypothetical protein
MMVGVPNDQELFSYSCVPEKLSKCRFPWEKNGVELFASVYT